MSDTTVWEKVIFDWGVDSVEGVVVDLLADINLAGADLAAAEFWSLEQSKPEVVGLDGVLRSPRHRGCVLLDGDGGVSGSEKTTVAFSRMISSRLDVRVWCPYRLRFGTGHGACWESKWQGLAVGDDDDEVL